MKPQRMDLCAECAKALEETGYTLRSGDHDELITCGTCRKRRLGRTYIVTKGPLCLQTRESNIA